MKLKINKNLRMILIFITFILIGIISFLLYKEFRFPDSKDVKVVFYNYKHKADINYKVFLKPNILYDSNNMGEGEIYIANFIDNIKATFKYEYNGDRTADIKGDYEVIASVEGYMTVKDKDKDKDKTIWKKQFVLSPKENFSAKDKSVSIIKEIPINYQDYDKFAQQVIKDSKVSTLVKLSVIMNINLKAYTENGIIEQKLSPSIICPLSGGSFQIVKSQTEEKPGTIEQTKKVDLPINNKEVALYCSILVVLIIALLYIIFLTFGIVVYDPSIKRLNRIFKEHGNRMVALESEIAALDCCYKVRSIDDLVKVADEIGKPIMYKYSADPNNITQFYVYDGEKIYVLDIKNDLLSSNPQKYNNRDKRQSKFIAWPALFKTVVTLKFNRFMLWVESVTIKTGRHETKENKIKYNL